MKSIYNFLRLRYNSCSKEATMSINEYITVITPYYQKLRQNLHSIPEIGFKEYKTADIIAKELDRLGVEYKRGIGGTGIVAWIRCGSSEKSIALRADMDALSIEERNSFAYTSQYKGLMHACGHDGHMAMLLGAVDAIAKNKELFDGTIYFIFQPAEEGLGGAKAMVDDGLFEQFKIDKIYAIHNRPTEPFGKIFVKDGVMMASYDNYRIEVLGKSTHSSMPHTGKNPLVAAAHIVTAMKSITSLDLNPNAKSVVTVASIHGGEADNIIPDSCVIGGSIRAFDSDVRKEIEKRVKEIATYIAKGFGMEAKVEYNTGYPATVNSDTTSALKAAVATVGKENVVTNFQPSYGSEDFSYLLQRVPGAYAWLGSGEEERGSMTLHSSTFDFNDKLIPIGVRYFYELAKAELGRE